MLMNKLLSELLSVVKEYELTDDESGELIDKLANDDNIESIHGNWVITLSTGKEIMHVNLDELEHDN